MTRLAGAALLIGGASALAAPPASKNPAVAVPPSVARRAEAPLRAGFAKRVITPALDRPVYLAGFGHDRRATGLHDDLFARCLAVSVLTADYHHFLVRKVEDALGGTTVFVAGAIGGLMTPLSVDLKDAAGRRVPLESFAHAEAIGRRAAEAALAALSGTSGEPAAPPGAMPAKAGARAGSASSALEYRSRRVFVPLANTLFRLGFAVGIFERPLFTHGLPDKGTGLALYEGVPLPLPKGEDLETEIGYLRIGDAEILLVPGEIYPELVRGGVQEPQDAGADFLGAPREAPLLGLLTARHRMVIGLASDAIGYIVPRSQWDEKPPFAYGRAESQYGEVNSVGDRAAPVLASAFARLLGRPDPR